MNVATIRNNEFLKHNAIFFTGSVFVGVLNYLYYPIIGRILPPASFGEVQTLVSLFLQFTIFLNVLGMITVNIITNYADTRKAHQTIVELEKFAAYLSLGLLAFSLLCGEYLRQSLRFDSSLPFAALALALIVSIPLTFRSAYARSQKRFGIAVSSQLIGALCKLMFSIGLVVLGLGTLGAIGGIVVAQFVAFLYAARWAGRLGFSQPQGSNYSKLPDMRAILPELKYAGLVFTGLFCVTLLMSIDILVVKYLFDAETAGLYAGIATVARIIFFLSAPIAQVLLPSLKISDTPDQSFRQFKKSLLITLIVSAPVLFVCVLTPDFVVMLLMGAAYAPYAHLLPQLALAVFLLSIANLFCMYSLSLRQKAGLVFCGLGLLPSLVLMTARHSTPDQIVENILSGALVTVFAAVVHISFTMLKTTNEPPIPPKRET